MSVLQPNCYNYILQYAAYTLETVSTLKSS